MTAVDPTIVVAPATLTDPTAADSTAAVDSMTAADLIMVADPIAAVNQTMAADTMEDGTTMATEDGSTMATDIKPTAMRETMALATAQPTPTNTTMEADSETTTAMATATGTALIATETSYHPTGEGTGNQSSRSLAADTTLALTMAATTDHGKRPVLDQGMMATTTTGRKTTSGENRTGQWNHQRLHRW